MVGRKFQSFLLVIFLFSILNMSYGAIEKDRIVDIEALELNFKPNFDQYAGEIIVDKAHDRRLFYWFVESQNNPETDPVVLWLQGGPGCSSLLALVTENGPYQPNPVHGMDRNPFSWNKIANVIYVESPAGVGFSYSNDKKDYNTNNKKTAADNYIFLQKWFEGFSEFKNNRFWITGESYAGDYVPQLVKLIIDGPDKQLAESLEGIMLGNPVIDCPAMVQTSNNMQVQLLYWHALIPYSAFSKWMSLPHCVTGTGGNQKVCTDLANHIMTLTGPTLDPDDMYMNSCTGNATLDISETVPGCKTLADRRTAYFNTAAVQKAIHAHPAKWMTCTSNINYTTSFPSILPDYEYFFKHAPHLRMLIYSGDVDIATVPHPMTQLCLHDLHRPMLKPWTEWKVGGIVAGYTEVYDKYTFATVKGAGHMVPMFLPRPAYVMFERFLNNQM